MVDQDQQFIADNLLGPAGTAKPNNRNLRRKIVAGLLMLFLLVTAGVLTWSGNEPEAQGMVFTIAEGSYRTVAAPGIDSVVAIPTQITFQSVDEAAITIINHDVVTHRAGPFVVGPGQTYVQRFPAPGEYPIACSVDPAESVVVTVKG